MGRRLLAVVRQQYIGLIALFIALGGVSYGAATGAINSREIQNDTIRSRDIHNRAIRGRDMATGSVTSRIVKNQSLLEEDFKLGELPAGPRGATGARGATGPGGPAGSARAYAFVDALHCANTPGLACPIGRSKGITRVSGGVQEGSYCVTAPGLSPRTRPIFGTPDFNSVIDVITEVRSDAKYDSFFCPPGKFTVLTYVSLTPPDVNDPRLQGDVSFSLLIP